MRFAFTLSLVVAPLLAQAVSPAHMGHAHRRSSVPASNPLQKRENGFATWYDVGLGACGWWNNPGDFIVAMNSNEFPQDGYPSSICGKELSITGPLGTVTAVVADECPMGNYNCNYGDMDMSQGLFVALFGDLGVGKGPISWYYTGGGGGTGAGSGGGNNGGNNNGGGQQAPPPPDPSPNPPPQSSSPPPNPPASSSPQPPPPSSSPPSQSHTTSSAAPTTSNTVNIQDVTGGNNLNDLNKFFIQLQGLLEKGLELQ